VPGWGARFSEEFDARRAVRPRTTRCVPSGTAVQAPAAQSGSGDSARQRGPRRRAAAIGEVHHEQHRGSVREWKTRDKAHYFQIARGSATECVAILDECVDYGFLADDQVRPALETLSRVVAMLIRIVLSLEERAESVMGGPCGSPARAPSNAGRRSRKPTQG
jgi:four helix bundle protein